MSELKHQIAFYSRDGIFIKSFSSMKEASLFFKVNSRYIDKHIRLNDPLILDHQWRKVSINEECPKRIDPYVEDTFSEYSNDDFPIDKYTLKGRYLRSYESISKASKAVHGDRRAISRVVKGKQKSAYGFYWTKKGESPTINKYFTKSVLQYDLDGKLLKRYKSVKQASLESGVKEPNIRMCLNNKQHHSGGYIWKRGK